MDSKKYASYVKCGRVFDPDLPFQLDPSEPPILLAEVTVDPKLVKTPNVLIQFSEFIDFAMFGLNPVLFISYRLVREDKKNTYGQILQVWDFEVEAAEIREVGDLVTSQPTVLNYCDCLNGDEKASLTYKLEISQIETNNVRSLDITNKSLTATLLSKAPKHTK
jgi:hypothetical protein